MNSDPRISVILPVYNGGEFICDAIESILAQTFQNFELIIIDDGSTDNSAEKLSTFTDPRIVLLSNEKNRGLVETLNRGIAAAKGEYIARMDADDISRPERFEAQISFLEKNSGIGVCGTWMYMIHNETVYKHRYLTNELISAALLFTNPIVHPSVMMRRSVFLDRTKAYDTAFPHGEDYALWVSLLGKTGFAVLDTPLIEYRAHAEQVSRKFNVTQRASVGKAQEIIFDRLGIIISEEEKEIHLSLFLESYKKTKAYYSAAEKWLLKLIAANEQTKFFDNHAFRNITGEWWFRLNRELAPSGIGSYSKFKISGLSSGYTPSAAAVAKLRVKSILKPGKRN
jgi:glycosyltransferase involved in cell wall biosynthesis